MNWRKALTWALWSPRRLLLCFAGVVIVIACIARAGTGTGAGAQAPVEPGTSATTSNPATGHGSTPPNAAPTSTTTSVAPPSTGAVRDESVPADAVSTAVSFVTAWARPQLSEKAWLAGVAPLATPVLASGLHFTNPRTVPASKVTGPATASPDQPLVSVPTNTGPITVELQADGSGRWLVSSILPAASP